VTLKSKFIRGWADRRAIMATERKLRRSPDRSRNCRSQRATEDYRTPRTRRHSGWRASLHPAGDGITGEVPCHHDLFGGV
jgi:hypothetical protein